MNIALPGEHLPLAVCRRCGCSLHSRLVAYARVPTIFSRRVSVVGVNSAMSPRKVGPPLDAFAGRCG